MRRERSAGGARAAMVAVGACVLFFGAGWFLARRGAEPAPSEQTPSGGAEDAGALIPVPEDAVAPASGHRGFNIYTDPARGWRVRYPDHFVVDAFDEGGGSVTTLFHAPGERGGFQIFTAPFPGLSRLSIAELRRVRPFMTVEEPQEITLPAGVGAVLFFSAAPDIGRTREVWFARDGTLYGATARAADDGLLSEVMATFAFR